MLEHLLEANPADFLPIEKASATQLLDAQYKTSLLDDLGVLPDDEAHAIAQQNAAREAFLSISTGQTDQERKKALIALEVPEAVKELVGMLTAYDWEFVHQAKELRGYTVAKLTEETSHPDARIRLKALELLGKVTEVALFSERTEIKQVGLSDAELDGELKKRLDKYQALERDVEGVEVLENKEEENADSN